MRNGTETPGPGGRPKSWPLFLIAAPAAVAIWSGWVGLGELCGFGPVRLLPGITGWTLNTAITLPVGVEAYAGYAIGAWMSPAAPEAARRFARRSAIGALVYGMAGQVIFHLLSAAHATRAPWPVVVVVSCMPVAVLGLAAGLTHLLRAEQAPAAVSAGVSAGRPGGYRLPPQRELMTSLGVGQGKARKVQVLLRAASNGHGGVDDA